jgi:hypothetical protein
MLPPVPLHSGCVGDVLPDSRHLLQVVTSLDEDAAHSGHDWVIEISLKPNLAWIDAAPKQADWPAGYRFLFTLGGGLRLKLVTETYCFAGLNRQIVALPWPYNVVGYEPIFG